MQYCCHVAPTLSQPLGQPSASGLTTVAGTYWSSGVPTTAAPFSRAFRSDGLLREGCSRSEDVWHSARSHSSTYLAVSTQRST